MDPYQEICIQNLLKGGQDQELYFKDTTILQHCILKNEESAWYSINSAAN